MRLIFDETRAKEVFAILEEGWRNKTGVFKGIVLPQERWSLPSDPKMAANHLSYAAITMRGGILSERPVELLAALREKHLDLFDPFAVVSDWPAERIEEVIVALVKPNGNGHAQQLLFPEEESVSEEQGNKGLYKLDEFARSWHHNSLTLVDHWQRNVLEVFGGVTEFEQAFARIDYEVNPPGFTGMRRKIFSLFTIWLQEFGYIPVFPTPVPVDFHAMRVLFATGVVRAEDVQPFHATREIHPAHLEGRIAIRVTEKVMDEIAIWSQGFMVREGFSHLAINPALWVLSRELCVREFQNKALGTKEKKVQLIYPETLVANPDLWPARYQDPARHCPLAGLCTKVISHAPYYRFGLLVPLERLEPPPTGQLALSDDWGIGLLPEIKHIKNGRAY